MRVCLIFFLAFSFVAIAAEQYGVYDTQGNRISTFEAEQHELPQKTLLAKEKEPNKNLYVSSLSKGKSSKPTSRYRYKAETGAYIEATRKETISICPDKEIQGTWISEYSVSLNAENCIIVQTSNLAGTFRILLLQNSGKTDTIQVLVDQSYIQMGDYSHKVYVYDQHIIDSITSLRPEATWSDVLPGNYESKVYDMPLIVDKTKFTMGDASYYLKLGNIIKPKIIKWDFVYQNENLEESRRPYIGGQEFRFANERSKKEGLDTAYIRVDIRDYNAKNTKNYILLGDVNAIDASYNFLVVDTSSSGYRVPFKEEWFFLMRAGTSSTYYWGDYEDSLKVSRYAWVSPVGLKQVAKLQPNRFGLYDMVGIAKETIMDYFSYTKNGINYNYYGWATTFSKCPECYFMRKTRTLLPVMRMPSKTKECEWKENKKHEKERICADIEQKSRLVNEQVNFDSFRFLRKTPKLHKLEKF
ncbi:hypothetical protein AGMMS49938_04580 [Fibrobacterales bacterium]|nr:hypothetical protein AGMMS49938_04580 [Fibrobacterales bacterium]